MPYDPNKHHRRSIRLPGYDYAAAGAYFVTVCTQNRQPLFGEVQNGEMCLSEAGHIVWRCWNDLPNHYAHVKLDAFITMPDHVHAIIVLDDSIAGEPENHHLPPRHGLAEIVRAFKSFSARRINELRRTAGIGVWQRNYYERIVRDEQELHQIRAYIIDNPVRWHADDERRVVP
jgi:REP element-mobilizing transposase RayT